MGSEHLKKRLSLASHLRPAVHVSTFVMTIAMTMVLLLTLSTVVCAETDLDDVTMRVIGLDEIPTHSLQIIELPQADLGELADINESLKPGAVESSILPGEAGDSFEPSPSNGDEITSEPQVRK